MPTRIESYLQHEAPLLCRKLGLILRWHNELDTRTIGGRWWGDVEVEIAVMWTGPFNFERVGSCTFAHEVKPTNDKTLPMKLPMGMRGVKATDRVSLKRCKSCLESHNIDDNPPPLPTEGINRYCSC